MNNKELLNLRLVNAQLMKENIYLKGEVLNNQLKEVEEVIATIGQEISSLEELDAESYDNS